MIILKYGNAKKLESAKRWKCKCPECGCKVILDKEDVQNYKNYPDSDDHKVTKFYWICPYCEAELNHEEYDDPLVRITEPILDKIEDFTLYHEELCVVIVVILVMALFVLLIWGAFDLTYKYYNNKYNYRIEYVEDDGETQPYYSIIHEDETGKELCGYSSYDLDVISSYLKVYFGVNDHLHKAVLYHCTTPKKAKQYRETGAILKPVRGFTTLQAAMAWCIHTGRTVIYEIKGGPAYKLPDHHNKFVEAWWIDQDVPVDRIKAVRFDLQLHKCGEVKEDEECK